jgi:hypothetical protein
VLGTTKISFGGTGASITVSRRINVAHTNFMLAVTCSGVFTGEWRWENCVRKFENNYFYTFLRLKIKRKIDNMRD